MSAPVIWFRFRDLDDAQSAAEFDDDTATLTIPLPVLVPVADTMTLRFRIGGGELREATGTAQAHGEKLVLRFEGQDAGIVRDAIHKLAHPKRPRAYPRFRCWMPVVLEVEGQQIHATACDIAVGGARLTALPENLAQGSHVGLRFGSHPQAVAARVCWSATQTPGGMAGVAFETDPATLPLVRRLVTEAAHRALPT